MVLFLLKIGSSLHIMGEIDFPYIIKINFIITHIVHKATR